MMGFGYGMGGWGGFGWIASLLFLAILVLGVAYLWRAVDPGRHDRSGRGSDPSDRADDRALQILRERYARGEIDQEEYERRKAGLA